METYLTPYGRERLQAGDAIVKQVEQQPGAVPDERDLDQVSLVSLATSLRTWVCRIGFRPGGGKWRVGTAMGGRRETTKRQIEQFQHSIKKGEPAFALVLTLAEKQVQEIDIIANPEKLRHIPALSFEEEI